MANISGQASERNFTNAVNKFANLKVVLNGKTHIIESAKQLGGGAPEPKADVALITKDGKSLGISMKKPNFGFFESWMDEAKLKKLLLSVGLTDAQSIVIVKALKGKLTNVMRTAAFKSAIESEYDAMIDKTAYEHTMFRSGRTFKGQNLTISESDRTYLLKMLPKQKDGMFGTIPNKPTSKYKIENVYAPLKELLGGGYKAFLKTVIGGDATNPHPAEYIIVETISPNITKAKLILAIQNAQTVDAAVKHYLDDPDVNLKFRLRPMTVTRAAYSKTNLGKYKKGLKFHCDMTLGVSWTVFVVP